MDRASVVLYSFLYERGGAPADGGRVAMTMRSGVPLADMSANFVAAFALMLIASLTLGGGGGGGGRARSGAEAIERRALRGEEMVDLLYSRRNASRAVVIDVFDDHVEILRDGGLRRTPPDADAIAAASRGAGEAAVFVFAHGAYRAATTALARQGIQWRELSVPRALRDDSGAGWSLAFIALGGQGSRAAFRDGLARLLAGGGGRAGALSSRGDASGPFWPGSRAGAFLRPLGAAAALAGCALLARWAERRR
jgi:hypothetical protein